MPFPTITSDGIDIVCLVTDHDWSAKVAISHFFAGEITAGLSDREGRRPEAEAMLLTAAVTLAIEADEAQAFRQMLATVGKGWIGLPIMADTFLGSDYAVAGARIYAPQRLYNLTNNTIVDAASTLTAGHTYAPLLVGHITDLPPLKAMNGTFALCALTLTEDSPWAFRFASAVTGSAGTWPAALDADWSTPPTQTPVQGLQFERIGQQREQTIADEERALRWTAEAGFTLMDKTEMATLLGFFIASRGQWAPFTAPLWWQPGTPSAQAPNSTTVRFTDPVLKLEYDGGPSATTRIKFSQLPWEISGVSGETPQLPARIYLYQITYALPTPQIYRYTNCWRPLTRTSDGTYNPAPMEHDVIEGGLDLSSERVTLNSFLFSGNPLALFNPNVLEGRMWLRIFEIETDPIAPDSAVLKWFGSIAAAPQTGRKFAADCVWLGGILDREVPNVKVGPVCNTYMFSSRCGHLKSSFIKTGTLFSSSDTVVAITTSDSAGANTYAPGKIEVGTGLNYESRLITASAVVSGRQQFTLDRPLRQAASGQAVNYYRSCDRSLATCKALDSSGWRGRFRAHPFVPQVNLSLPTMPSSSGSGKK